MFAYRAVLLLLMLGCAGEPQADVRWLINENTEEVMGLVGRGAPAGSTRMHRFVLLECASYDLFAAASEMYQQQEGDGKRQVPRGCRELVTTELSREQLKESKKEVAKKLEKNGLVDGLLENLTEGLNSGAVFSMLGLSSKNTKVVSAVVEKLKSLEVLPKIPAQGKIKKGLVIVSTLALLVSSSGLLRSKGHEHYQAVLDELSGAEHSRRMQDQETSQQSYEEIKQLLTSLVEDKTSSKTQQLKVSKLARAVAN